MAKASCKCKKTECEECPEWIFTFADLVMLMMGFFVILWVLKPGTEAKKEETKAQEEQKWLNTVGEIRKGFGWEANPTSTDPVDQAVIQQRERLGEGKGGKTETPPRGAEGTEREVQSVRPGKHAVVGTRILFEAGQDALPADAPKKLDQIVKIIQGHRQIFLVKGHTSQDDFGEGAASQDQMNLSVRRAQRVADYLMKHGVEPEILRVQGCSTFEPVVLRAYTEDARTQNRRVEVEGTDSPVSERQDAVKTSRALPPDLESKTASTPTETIDHR
jgi:flagellar motor protein MotB